MSDHDAFKPSGDEVAVGSEIDGQLVQVAVINGERRMGVGARSPVGGEVLGRHGHARSIGAGGKFGAQDAHYRRAGMQRSVADHLGQLQVQVHHRREAQIDIQRSQFRGHEPAECARGLQRLLRVAVMEAPKRPHRRQLRKRSAESLHSTAFVIHGHQQRRVTGGVDFGHQPTKLSEVPVVAGKEDHAPNRGRQQPRTLFGVELGPLEIDHQRPQGYVREASIHRIQGLWPPA